MKKKLCALFLAVLMMISLCGCVSFLTASVVYHAILADDQEYAAVVKANWDIALPSGFELLFYESTPSPFGEGPRYCVLQYEDETVLDHFMEWTKIEGTTWYFDFVEEAMESLNVPEEYHFDYTNCEWWYYSDPQDQKQILIMHEGDMLCIVERFH